MNCLLEYLFVYRKQIIQKNLCIKIEITRSENRLKRLKIKLPHFNQFCENNLTQTFPDLRYLVYMFMVFSYFYKSDGQNKVSAG